MGWRVWWLHCMILDLVLGANNSAHSAQTAPVERDTATIPYLDCFSHYWKNIKHKCFSTEIGGTEQVFMAFEPNPCIVQSHKVGFKRLVIENTTNTHSYAHQKCVGVFQHDSVTTDHLCVGIVKPVALCRRQKQWTQTVMRGQWLTLFLTCIGTKLTAPPLLYGSSLTWNPLIASRFLVGGGTDHCKTTLTEPLVCCSLLHCRVMSGTWSSTVSGKRTSYYAQMLEIQLSEDQNWFYHCKPALVPR